jgi:hypothetical protein
LVPSYQRAINDVVVDKASFMDHFDGSGSPVGGLLEFCVFRLDGRDAEQ